MRRRLLQLLLLSCLFIIIIIICIYFNKEYINNQIIHKYTYNQDALNIIKYSTSDRNKFRRLSNIKVAIIDQGITNQPNINFIKLYESNRNNESSHGTILANLFAAKFDSNSNYQGLIPDMPLYGYSLSADKMNASSLAEAIETVTTWGVDIISISMGTNKEDEHLKKAVQDAVSHGIVIICSAGNDPYEVNYPASFNIHGVISVGAIGNDYNILPNTNFNSQIDIYAPGENIASIPNVTSDIEVYTGTSVAVPFVTMACVYIKAYTESLNAEEIEEYLIKNTEMYLAKWRNQQMEIKLLDMSQLMKSLIT